MRLGAAYYQQPTLKLSRDLLGKFLVARHAGKKYVGRIIETEAYVGPHDTASHASRGRTPRTDVMFWSGGHWYVYLIYGMYHCLNMVTEREGYPAAILIRSIEPVNGFAQGIKTDGPGKICRAMDIDRSFNQMKAYGTKTKLWIEDRGKRPSPNEIRTAPRIGVAYAGSYKDKPWRFYLNLTKRV